MKKQFATQLLSLILAFAMVAGFAVPVKASGLSWKETDMQVSFDLSDNEVPQIEEESDYSETDMVRVSIVMEDKPTVQMGYPVLGIAQNADALRYNDSLLVKQETMAQKISTQVLGGDELDVVWNMTLVGNMISANVPYGKLDELEAMDGVEKVVLERVYEPQQATRSTAQPKMITSGNMIGSGPVWAEGYTGAGSRIAVVDTGTDLDHQSFNNEAYLYSLEQNAKEKNMSVDEYKASLNLLDEAQIDSVLKKLNVYEKNPSITASELYLNEKLSFGYNYVDNNLELTHDNDQMSAHGSHVAGIATANRYIPKGDSFVDAGEEVHMVGVAPDAQLITMKVFGAKGGAYDSDYMAAIEDAIMLGCDVVNLSLGTSSVGSPYEDTFEDLLNYLSETDIVVSISGGNAGAWADNTPQGNLYSDDVSFDTASSPGSYKNAFTVASVDNAGTFGYYFEVDGEKIAYIEKSTNKNRPFRELAGEEDSKEYEYVFVEGIGTKEDYEGIDLENKIVFCSRGDTSFVEKANIAASLGAAGIVIYNNAPGFIGLDLTGYEYTQPCVSIYQADANAVKEHSEPQTTADGRAYYTGKLVVESQQGAVMRNGMYAMSLFSSWGVPGDLSIKPEITAPGGEIYSVEGQLKETDRYVYMSGTSMAAPQIAGMTALAAQYFRETGLAEKMKVSPRVLAQSLLMSTADPLREEASGGNYYSILNQGAGLARIDDVVSADSYIMVDGQPDGKVKAELGHDPERTGEYKFSFTIHNITQAKQEYALDADVFLQNVQAKDGYEFVNKQTHIASSETVFSVNGKPVENDGISRDLNGDGKTNEQDADYLLEYLLGNESELKADGDVNGDGTVNTYDAHDLLAQLGNSMCVEVPAGGTTQVEVAIQLSDETKEYLNQHNPKGGYVQAFVNVNGLADEEGNAGTQHAIPVLAYYGDWSEPSMYDRGSYAEYKSGLKQPSYLESVHGNQINFLGIDYSDGNEYVYAGNPLAQDEEYLEYRNAMNNSKENIITNQYFSLIRDVGASKITITDTKTGEVYKEVDTGDLTPAYFSAANGAWVKALESAKINWDGTDAEGNKLPEGTTVEIAMAAAPHYYRNADKTFNYGALKDGAFLKTQITIDNTAPEAMEIDMVEGKKNTLRVTAKDDRYVAAVAIMNGAGNVMLRTASPNQKEAGQEVAVEMNLDGLRGNKFVVTVCDYALNVKNYEVTLDVVQEEPPHFTAIDYSFTNNSGFTGYVGFDTDGTGEFKEAPKAMGTCPNKAAPRAAEYVDGYVFEITDANELYVADEMDLNYFEYLGKLDPKNEWEIENFNDLAYNPKDDTLYGQFLSKRNEKAKPYLCTIDMHMGTMEVLGEMPEMSHTLAIDDKGNFYTIDIVEGIVYTFTLEEITAQTPTMKTVGKTGIWQILNEPFVSSTTWDSETGKLYWAFPSGLMLVDHTTGEATPQNWYKETDRMGGLYVRTNSKGNQFAPVATVDQVTITSQQEDLLVGQKLSLRGQVWPWHATDTTVNWKSSDDTLATVDENGIVTALKVGTVTITATSNLDSSKSASITLELKELDTKLNGLIWDKDGKAWWSEFQPNTLPNYKKICDTPATEDFGSAAIAPDGTIYAGTMNPNTLVSDLYKVDPKTFEATKIGGSSEVGYFDMAYAPNMLGGCLAVAYGPQLLFIDKDTGEMMEYIHMWYFDVVGVSYFGSVPFKDETTGIDTMVDFFVIVDSHGYVYLFGFLMVNGAVHYITNDKIGAELGNMGYQTDTYFFNSLHFDGQYAYWAALSREKNHTTLHAMDLLGSRRTYNMGTFGDGVWPVGGLMQLDAKAPASVLNELGANLTLHEPEHKEFQKVETPEITPDGDTNSASNVIPASAGQEEGKQVTVNVSANKAATNGRAKISYNPEELTLVSVNGNTPAFAYAAKDGTVEVAYANATEMSEGASAAALTFEVTGQAHDFVTVSVDHVELNNGKGEKEELKIQLADNCPSKEFKDLDLSRWYHEGVDFVLNKGIMEGVGNNLFNPNGKITRAQMVSMLYRMAGSPDVTGMEHSFTDVDENRWYVEAVLWAANNGITDGVTETMFAPNHPMTREQMVTFLHRYAKLDGKDMEASADLSQYADAKNLHEYAKESMAWAVAEGLIEGMDDRLYPVKTATRAQAATVVMRYYQ